MESAPCAPSVDISASDLTGCPRRVLWDSMASPKLAGHHNLIEHRCRNEFVCPEHSAWGGRRWKKYRRWDSNAVFVTKAERQYLHNKTWRFRQLSACIWREREGWIWLNHESMLARAKLRSSDHPKSRLKPYKLILAAQWRPRQNIRSLIARSSNRGV